MATPTATAAAERHPRPTTARSDGSTTRPARTPRGLVLVGYIRVSTDRQAERYGPAAQRHALREWAQATGHRITRVVEEATSGVLSEREGLGEVLDDVRSGRVAGVVVARLDRFSRDMLVQEHLMSDVWAMGGEVYSTAADENNLRDDPEDPSRKLIRRMLGAVVEYDREMTLLRLRNGRRAKARQGGFATGRPHTATTPSTGPWCPTPTSSASCG